MELPITLAKFELSADLLAQILPLAEGTRIIQIGMSDTTPDALTIIISNPDFRELREGERIPTANPLIIRGVNGELRFEKWFWPAGEWPVGENQ